MLCYERGGICAIAGIMPRVLQNQPDATLDLNELELHIPGIEDPHINPIRSIGLESSHVNCSGKVLSLDYIAKVRQIVDKHGIRMTLDGARSWNASVAMGIPMKEKVKHFDLVSVCMSKGMGSPIGSLVVGSHEDIRSAMNYRKLLGGSMR